jgi:hypothetical protein
MLALYFPDLKGYTNDLSALVFFLNPGVKKYFPLCPHNLEASHL